MSELTEKRIDPMLASYYGDQLIEVAEETVVEETGETPIVTEIEPESAQISAETETKPDVVAEITEVEKKIIQALEFESEEGKYLYDKLSKGELEDAYEALKQKFEHKSLSEEQKILNYLKVKNPYMDADDIAFTAASDYGVGVDAIEDDSFLTDEQKAELRKQGIRKKALLGEAQGYFDERATMAQLPTLANPLDTDQDYISYKQNIEASKQAEIESKQNLDRLYKEVDTVTSALNSIDLSENIALDGGELDFKSQFKLDDAKKKQLAEHVKDYTPTKAEIQASTINGEFDMKGYIQIQAEKLFYKQIQKSVLKEALSKSREDFIEKELTNSTLKNNQTTQQTNIDVPWEVSMMRAGRNR